MSFVEAVFLSFNTFSLLKVRFDIRSCSLQQKNATHVQDLGSGCDVCCSCGNVVCRRPSRGSTVGPDRPEGLAGARMSFLFQDRNISLN